jgi:hypothetical protein
MCDLILDFLAVEDGAGRLSRNVGNWLPINATSLPKGAKIPRIIIFIFHCGNVFRYINIRRSIAFMKKTLDYGSIIKHCFAFIVPCWNVAGCEIFEVCLYLRNKSLNYSFSVGFSLLTCILKVRRQFRNQHEYRNRETNRYDTITQAKTNTKQKRRR